MSLVYNYINGKFILQNEKGRDPMEAKKHLIKVINNHYDLGLVIDDKLVKDMTSEYDYILDSKNTTHVGLDDYLVIDNGEDPTLEQVILAWHEEGMSTSHIVAALHEQEDDMVMMAVLELAMRRKVADMES